MTKTSLASKASEANNMTFLNYALVPITKETGAGNALKASEFFILILATIYKIRNLTIYN